jgi:hypothetical protein
VPERVIPRPQAARHPLERAAAIAGGLLAAGGLCAVRACAGPPRHGSRWPSIGHSMEIAGSSARAVCEGRAAWPIRPDRGLWIGASPVAGLVGPDPEHPSRDAGPVATAMPQADPAARADVLRQRRRGNRRGRGEGMRRSADRTERGQVLRQRHPDPSVQHLQRQRRQALAQARTERAQAVLDREVGAVRVADDVVAIGA